MQFEPQKENKTMTFVRKYVYCPNSCSGYLLQPQRQKEEAA